MPETILIVDDEESIRRTFCEWLEGAGLGSDLFVAGDAESALKIANERTIDLAILDWNLGAGNNGLQLLEDLYLFNPDVTAIMVTGYANQATPLDAMRIGIRDYLDKNQDLRRDTFLQVVMRQLERIRPAKRERQLHRGLMEFRTTVEKILPLVRTTAALNDPVPFTDSVRHLFRFLLRTTGASDGALLVRSYDAAREPAETYRAYNIDGQAIDGALVPFSQSLAGAIVSMDPPCVATELTRAPEQMGIRLQPFEQPHRFLLAACFPVSRGLNVVLELFDKRPENVQFTDADRRLVASAAEFGAEMIKQSLAERQTQKLLVDAVAAALEASQNVSAALSAPTEGAKGSDRPLAAPLLDQLRQSLAQFPIGVVDPDQAVKLAELLRVIAARHGRQAVEHCIQLLESVDRLLRTATEAR